MIPFVGPYFNYAMHSDQTWHWFMNRFWLEVLPAIAAIVGGLILMGGITRASTSLGALIALAGGIWFIVGPVVSMLWNHGVMAGGPPIAAHNVTRMLEWIGFFYGTGALITVFSAYALGFLAALPIVDERVVGRTVAAGAGAGAGYAAGRATAPRGGADEPAAAPADRAAAPADRAAAPADRAAAPADRAAAPADTAAAPADTAAAPAGAAPADTAAAPADRSAAPAGTATAPAAGASTTTGQPAANTAPRRRTGRFFRRRRSSTRA